MKYSEYVKQLKADQRIFTDLLNSIDPDRAQWKPDEERWSVLEIINHLADIEVEDFRSNFELILFHPEDPWPHYDEIEWITSRKYNEQNLLETMKRFMRERDKSILWLERLKNPDLEKYHLGNESSGVKKRAGDILSSWIAHDLFHMRQLVLIQYDILNKSVSPYSTTYSGFYR